MQKRFHLKFLYRYLIFIVFLINVQIGKSQSVYLGNLYPYNKYHQNPAYAGYEGLMTAILDYRIASSAIQGTPKQLMFGLHLPVYNNMGLGGRIENQSEGLFSFFTGFIDYSYRVNINNKQNLRFGISAGIQSSQLDNSNIIAADPSAIIEIASANFIGTVFESAAGIVYQWDNLEVNLAIPRLFGVGKELNPSFTSGISYQLYTLDNQLVLTPDVFVLYQPNTPLLYDINLIANFQEKFMLGVAYRNRPGIVISAGVAYANIRLNYAAELSAERYANIFNTIHEIAITYQFKKVEKLPTDSLYNPPLVLIVKNDSTNADSSIVNNLNLNEQLNDSIANISTSDTSAQIQSFEELNTKQDSLIDNDDNAYEILEVGSGVFILKPRNKKEGKIDETRVDSLLNTELFYKDNDIVPDTELLENNKPDEYEIIELGNGVFTIKQNDTTNQINNNIPEELIDSLVTLNMFISKSDTNAKPVDNNKEVDYFHEVYYTVQVFINSNSKILVEDYELAEQLRVEMKSSGKINYFFGKFSEKKSAEQAMKQLKKRGVKKLRVCKKSVYH